MLNIVVRILKSVVGFSLLLFALAACKEDLYTNLDEKQANELVAVLAASNIPSSRVRDKDGIYVVRVDELDVALAITILQAHGLPREKFEALGDVFSADGIVGTPFEEQARFIHAMNQELSHVITSISGVQSAQVLVTAPPARRYETTPLRASASVVVHYESGFDGVQYVSTIKTIVSHSLPNLNYDDVAVALFPAGGPTLVPNKSADVPLNTAGLGTSALVRDWWVAVRSGEPKMVSWSIALLASIITGFIALRAVLRGDRIRK